MKVIITGSNGQLGWELQRSAPDNYVLIAVDVDQLDITDAEAVDTFMAEAKSDLIINCAAYTAVDKAETEAELCYAINAQGAENLAKSAKQHGTKLIHISTDFVFDGDGQSTPYKPDAQTNPIGVYGASKLKGEQCVQAHNPEALIIRTAWVYSSHGQNFVKSMLRLMNEKEQLGVVADQIGSPTWAGTLANSIWQLSLKGVQGLYHCTDAGVASWYDFAIAIQEEALALGLLEKPIQVKPIPSSAYPTPAKRPHFSVLDKQMLWETLGTPPVHWRVALRGMLSELKIH